MRALPAELPVANSASSHAANYDGADVTRFEQLSYSRHMRCARRKRLTARHEIECPERVLQREHAITLPPRMAQEFRHIVTIAARNPEWKPSQEAISLLFHDEYLANDDFYSYVTHEIFTLSNQCGTQLALKVRYSGQGTLLRGEGEDLTHAVANALSLSFEVPYHAVHPGRTLPSQGTIAFVEISIQDRITFFGIGVRDHEVAARIGAVLSAVNRALRAGALDDSMQTFAT